jgi:hypothetical protein
MQYRNYTYSLWTILRYFWYNKNLENNIKVAIKKDADFKKNSNEENL